MFHFPRAPQLREIINYLKFSSVNITAHTRLLPATELCIETDGARLHMTESVMTSAEQKLKLPPFSPELGEQVECGCFFPWRRS